MTGYVGIIIPLYLFAFFRWNEQNAKRIFLAIAVAGLAGLAYNMEVSIHQWFDHNVVSHFIVTTFIIVLYTGVLKLLVLDEVVLVLESDP